MQCNHGREKEGENICSEIQSATTVKRKFTLQSPLDRVAILTTGSWHRFFILTRGIINLMYEVRDISIRHSSSDFGFLFYLSFIFKSIIAWTYGYRHLFIFFI